MDSNRKVKAYIEVRFNTDKEILLQAVDLIIGKEIIYGEIIEIKAGNVAVIAVFNIGMIQ